MLFDNRLWGFGLHGRKEQDITDGVLVGQHHYQTIDTDTLSGSRCHTVAECFDKIGVHMHRLVIACGFFGIHLCLESFQLIERIIELVEAIGDLFACHKKLKPLCNLRILITSTGERRDIDRIVSDKGRVDELLFDKCIKELRL